ncbi:MAG TPA: NAD(P)/FAD-dependent oxidoreductase [Caldisericia bacterium]|nr:NAD(P)/FAD-dependent oxidoreductase [Caldisericia bacterium]HPF48737.1 NAD(P)/FAD-dependent oxidoreductase [Caldisericia bacterium]HPI83603.1 NAD(P)/FAD-dependent oxidoreductase [Caldisericia bacterium]HPQ93192.1 NAD(P)/FAD-dependent oxidoreductase [Caldisericia bacterium]HRV74975.1 NAD(P)/FAD-dependent oxidoreductase [Caldisericia bacterium]
MKEVFDVAIIGAGAAGLTLAKNLDSLLKVVLFDKKSVPHDRIACAEWVPPMFPIEPVVKTDSMVTSYDNQVVENKFYGKIIDRESWQKDLLTSIGQNVTVKTGELVTKVTNNTVETKSKKYHAKLIVGADGPISVVRMSFGLPISPVLPAINVRLRVKRNLTNTLVHFMTEIEKGYGWYFPKGDVANVGVGATSNLRNALLFYVDFLKKRGLVEGQMTNHAAGLIPLFPLTAAVSDSVVLVGDAAGLTDPVTGAGINQAYDSALELAKIINSGKSVDRYDKYITKMYGRFLERRHSRRKAFEDGWGNLKKAVEDSWISFSQA